MKSLWLLLGLALLTLPGCNAIFTEVGFVTDEAYEDTRVDTDTDADTGSDTGMDTTDTGMDTTDTGVDTTDTGMDTTDTGDTGMDTTDTGDTGMDTDPAHDFFDIMEAGYVFAGDWHGYAWTSTGGVTGATITPTDFTAYTGAETQLCVSGSLTHSYESMGILGLNVNQAMGATAPALSWTPTAAHTGVYVDITKNVASTVRLQVTANGVTYCTDLQSGANTVLWSDLPTECWAPGGTPYSRQPITEILLVVPGDVGRIVTFDFCLNEIYPISP